MFRGAPNIVSNCNKCEIEITLSEQRLFFVASHDTNYVICLRSYVPCVISGGSVTIVAESGWLWPLVAVIYHFISKGSKSGIMLDFDLNIFYSRCEGGFQRTVGYR